MFLKTFVSLFTALLFLAGCSTSSKNASNPPSDKQQAMNQLNSSRDEYVSSTQARIDKMASLSKSLKDKASSAKDSTRAKKMENASNDLNSLLDDARKQLGEVKDAKTENWLLEKSDVENAMSRAETQYTNSIQLLR